MTLSDDQKKRLTEFLGECWHEIVDDPEYDYYRSSMTWEDATGKMCKTCKTKIKGNSYNGWSHNRPFTAPQDMMDLKDRLVEKGMYIQFLDIAIGGFLEKENADDIYQYFYEFNQWLINPATFIPLVAEFLEVSDGQKP